MICDISIVNETRLDPRFPFSRHELGDLMNILLDSLGLEGCSLVIKLVADQEIARLNKEFMGCVGPTNVLSFPVADEPELGVRQEGEGPVFLGELALSVDAVGREASLYGQPPVLHLARLLAHGTLHLAGYDHGDSMYDMTDAAVDRVQLEYAVVE